MKHHLGRSSSSPYVRFCFYVLVSSTSAAATVAALSTTTTTTITTNSVTSYSRQGFTRRFMLGGSNSNNNNNKNPLDLVSNLFGAAAKMTSTAGIDETTVRNVQQELENLAIFDWNEVQSHLESKMITPDERNFRANLSKGYGVMGSPLHKIRLYDESNREEDIRVVFYRDSASWCPYCQKVWLTLEEKKIPYRVEKINMRCYGEKPDSFKRLQPGGQIPVATIDGTTLRQSNDILFALEDLFPDNKSMMPFRQDASLEDTAQDLLRLERQIFSAWMYWLTQGGASSKANFIKTLDQVEQSLQTAVNGGPFFLGEEISIVDVQFAPFLERMAASLLYYKGFQIREATSTTTATKYPAINRWFDAMEELPSYQLTKSDYYTHCWDLPPQLGGCVSEPGSQSYQDAIDGKGKTSSSWSLPLKPDNGGIEPDWNWANPDEDGAKREAVERISANHEAIVRFAARGAGSPGFPRYGAPLSDPNATANDSVLPGVDYMLRLVCLALLDGTDRHATALKGAVATMERNGGKEYTEAVATSLAYLRDRIGVPRDMKLPAARQLRAHLNWAIEGINY